MTRYQFLRQDGCDPFSAGFISFMNYCFDVPDNLIGFMNVVIEFK